MATATGTFEVHPVGETEIHKTDDGPRLTHANGTQRFTGDIVGDGDVDWLMCYRADGTARFIGLQRISGSIAGRTGSVVLEATGNHDGTGSWAIWRVIEGTGTGDLEGIRGEGGFEASGGTTVQYRLHFEVG